MEVVWAVEGIVPLYTVAVDIFDYNHVEEIDHTDVEVALEEQLKTGLKALSAVEQVLAMVTISSLATGISIGGALEVATSNMTVPSVLDFELGFYYSIPATAQKTSLAPTYYSPSISTSISPQLFLLLAHQ
jgi:hypothetical protein